MFYRAGCLFFMAGFILLIFSQYCHAAPESNADRVGEVLFKNNRSDEGDYPFILEVKIASETSAELVLDIKYFLSDTIGDQYGISVHPETMSWGYTPNTLKPGVNTQKVIVSFKPQEPEITQSHSEKLLFEINRFANCVQGCNCKDMGVIFKREINFTKDWSN
jgi:hypothetical protein